MKDKNIKKKVVGFTFNLFWMYAIIGAVLVGFWYMNDSSVEKEVSWSEFEGYVLQKGVTDMEISKSDGEVKAKVTENMARDIFGKELPKNANVKKNVRIVSQAPSADAVSKKIEQWKEDKVFTGSYKYTTSGGFSAFLFSFGPIILLVALWFFLFKRMSKGSDGAGGGIFSVGKSKAQLFDKGNGTNVTFKDVAGLYEAKTEIEEIVEFLKNPQRYTDLGGKIPKGALLVGPPGTGKTLLAKAVAGEANVPFFSLSGCDFVEMFVGVGASRVRDLFKKAKE